MVLDTSYKVSLDRIGAIAHSNSDIKHIIFEKQLGIGYFNKFKSYGVISPIVRTMSIAHGVYRIPHVVEVGCFRNLHQMNTSKELKSIGYVGAIHRHIDVNESVDIKRGKLIEKVCEITGLELFHIKNLHFLCSDQFYSSFDMLMFASLTEGLPTVAIEAFCSGIPILGTHTGIFPKLAESGGGIVLPFEENEFIEKAVTNINDLKNNPEKYQHMTRCAFEESKNYDWSITRKSWLKFIDSLYL